MAESSSGESERVFYSPVLSPLYCFSVRSWRKGLAYRVSDSVLAGLDYWLFLNTGSSPWESHRPQLLGG